jgi:hypothetical protein
MAKSCQQLTRAFGQGLWTADRHQGRRRIARFDELADDTGLKEGAYRIELVSNKPSDLGLLARICHLLELIDKARQVNHRVLMIERAGQGCAIGTALFERIHQPYNREGQRTGALRFGDPRAMALAGALLCRPRRRRVFQPEPSRAGGRTPPRRLQRAPDDL